MKTRPRLFMANKFMITMVIYRNRFIFYLKMSLKSGENISHCFYLFFNEHEDRIKTARILRLFFNEHELYAKTARILRLFFNEHELCAKSARSGFLFFNELEPCGNTAHDKFACPQHNNANRGACPPSFIAFKSVVGMKVYL